MSEKDQPTPEAEARPAAPTEAPATPQVDAPEDPDGDHVDHDGDHDSRSRSLMREIASGDLMAGVLAVLLAVFVGSVMIAATDETVRETASYITARPSDFFTAVWDAVSGAYTAMFRGSVFNYILD